MKIKDFELIAFRKLPLKTMLPLKVD